MISFSVLIVTRNEEHDLPRCLSSLSLLDDVVVYDSFSTDRTPDIARLYGARLVQRPDYDKSQYFGGDESSHRNWALRNITFKYPWVFILDADEVLSNLLIAELTAIANTTCSEVAWRVRRCDFFQSKLLTHAQSTSWYTRFVRPEFISYERIINPVTIVRGLTGNLNNSLAHYPFSKGISHWIDRHNSYSSLEAKHILSRPKESLPRLLSSMMRAADYSSKRKYLKSIYYHLPFRPIIKFIYLYIIKSGFLDGSPGLTYSLLVSFYEWLIILKVQESTSDI
ncbi:glycosyltransferase family 2 protein [Synechococcus sp. W4D4]|uniref:glycosyltransferase family 2 protein n=1 Tax=Synechococcus sp. W4D4 TaxID=3392294 RepID=UPI0039E8D87C